MTEEIHIDEKISCNNYTPILDSSSFNLILHNPIAFFAPTEYNDGSVKGLLMNKISRDIFKAIHEGRWLSVEYKNKDQNITSYWIAVRDIRVSKRMLVGDGFHLMQHTLQELSIYIDSIQSSQVIEGSYYETNPKLLEDILYNPEKYQTIFNHVSNLKILNYLIDCSRLDTTPYRTDYGLISHLDSDSFIQGAYCLDDRQFAEIVRNFQRKAETGTGQRKTGGDRGEGTTGREGGKLTGDRAAGSKPTQAGGGEAGKPEPLKMQQLAMNVLSLHTKKGLYVLAYRKLYLDVRARSLVPAKEITVCREFTVDGERLSIRKFMDPGDYQLLDAFESNQELIKDRITAYSRQIQGVDDMPYVIAIEGRIQADLNREYKGILDMYDKGNVTYPVKAFFGDLLNRPDRRKEYPIALINNRVNLDQLLAIHKAMKYPLTYVQGPPGTGKTNTIINAIATAFFNQKTVLFVSYNNHPIDGVFEALINFRYQGQVIPFPVVRLGSREKDKAALIYMKELYEKVRQIKIFSNTLEKNRGDKIRRTRELTALLKRREEYLDLTERKEALEKLIGSNRQLTFTTELEGRQLYQVNRRLETVGLVTDAQALELLADDREEFFKYLFYMSASYIKRLDEPKNEDLRKILYTENEEERIEAFENYLKSSGNLKKFQRIFPIVGTTCISAHKLGEPGPHFDMVVMDEASQCNLAIGLIPIIRGENLLLVGDPQQLSPVILLDPKDNAILRKNYSVTKEYDYLKNSIYKTFLASDSVSDEILLSYHYRCDRKIIDFNNQKYYNSKLNIMTKNKSEEPLVYMEVRDSYPSGRNTSPGEAQAVVDFVEKHKDKRIGVITPFVNQKEYIDQLLKAHGIEDITCGTVHAFQGDEKDVVLFSMALTDQSHKGTYQWLKNNRELINVATSRAREQLVILGSSKNMERLRNPEEKDDLYELVEYAKTKGVSKVTPKTVESRALGVKPYSSETEEAFLENLNHALDNILYGGRRCVIHKEVGISHVFEDTTVNPELFYSGRFDFVVYERNRDKREIPILAIELDGKEHMEDMVVRRRDEKKQEICRQHGLELIRIENSYARRYHHMKEILIGYFEKLYRI